MTDLDVDEKKNPCVYGYAVSTTQIGLELHSMWTGINSI